MVDVLDVDRALLDAGAAGRAGPEHVRVDDPALRRRRRSAAGRPRPSRARRRRRAAPRWPSPRRSGPCRRRPAGTAPWRTRGRAATGSSSLGDSGLPVFQAGHCDWQRPHSVQVEKSSRPFQVNCSTWATPNWSFSGSASSKSSGLPSDIIGRSAPRPEPAGFAGSRLKKMFGNARNRCQATPIVTFSAITISQVIEMTILIAATTGGAGLPGGQHRRRGRARPAWPRSGSRGGRWPP